MRHQFGYGAPFYALESAQMHEEEEEEEEELFILLETLVHKVEASISLK
jgi:hypothetical protein